MSTQPLSLTPFHRSNLAKLALGLQQIDPKRFSMRLYAFASRNLTDSSVSRSPNNVTKDYNECGTICCACGHGPICGIPALANEASWPAYGERVFLGKNSYLRTPWNYLFHENWPNDIQMTVRRLAFVALTNSIPKSFDNSHDDPADIDDGLEPDWTFTNDQLQALILG